MPLLVSLLLGGAGITYGLAQRQKAPHQDPGSAVEARPPAQPAQHEQEAPAPAQQGPQEPAPAPAGQAAEDAAPVSSGGGGEGKEAKDAAKDAGSVNLKMEPIVANLDEGDQLRYLRVSLQLEVTAEAQQRAQKNLPRARHEALMYISGLRVADCQGQLGRQRVHRELQRRIADALGGGLKRVNFDEFVIQ